MRLRERIGQLISRLPGGDSGEVRKVTGNFIYLSILNGLNILLPLITLPYILAIIGKGNYGIYSYVYMVVQYVIIFSTYGFNFSATKQISESRDDKERVNAVYNAVIGAKIIIAVVLILLLYAFSGIVFRDEHATYMFFLGLGMVVGDIFTPIWLFQGMEKMKYLTIVNASSKILFTLLVFLLIRQPDDYILLILLNSAGYILAGVLSLILASRQFGMRLRMAPLRDVLFQLKDGSAVFGSTFGMYLYRNANVIILKQLVPNEVVGLYSAAEKVIKGFQSLISPVAQALFPNLSLRFKGATEADNIALLKRIALPFTAVVALISALVLAFAPWISDLLCGKEFSDCIPLIRIMTLVILFGEINYLIGLVGLVNLNRSRQFFRSVLVTGIFSVVFILTFVSRLGATAAALSMSLSEILLTMLCLGCLAKIRNTR